MVNFVKQITELVDKAAKAETPDNAMKFAQAALNIANAMISININNK